MIPRVSKPGHSFAGAGLYYLHDKDAMTNKRVAFTHTENLPTRDPDKALRWMTRTANHIEELQQESGVRATGRRYSGAPVFTFSLSWHPEEKPEQWQMIDSARQALKVLKLEEHEVLMVAHNDEAYAHIHCIVNRVHPETGRVNRLAQSKLRLSRWAEAYEKERGKIYCDQRVENNARRDAGEPVKYQEPELALKAHITAIYKSADSGKAFKAALEEQGYKLAQGERLVLIGRDGKMHSLTRQIEIEGVKAKDIRARLADVVLPTVAEARGPAHGQEGKKPDQHDKRTGQDKADEPEYFDRDEQDRQWQESIIDAALRSDSIARRQGKAPSPAPITPETLNALQDRHLAERGRFYDEQQFERDRLSCDLDLHYGVIERSLRRDIAELEATVKNSGRFRLWWLKLTKQIPWDTQTDLVNMRRSLDNIERRRKESVGALEARLEERRRTIEARQSEEKRRMDAALQRQMQEQARAAVIAQSQDTRRSVLAQQEFRRAQGLPPAPPTAVQDQRQRDRQRAAFLERLRGEFGPTASERPHPALPPVRPSQPQSAQAFAEAAHDPAQEARRAAFMERLSAERDQTPERDDGPTPDR